MTGFVQTERATCEQAVSCWSGELRTVEIFGFIQLAVTVFVCIVQHLYVKQIKKKNEYDTPWRQEPRGVSPWRAVSIAVEPSNCSFRGRFDTCIPGDPFNQIFIAAHRAHLTPATHSTSRRRLTATHCSVCVEIWSWHTKTAAEQQPCHCKEYSALAPVTLTLDSIFLSFFPPFSSPPSPLFLGHRSQQLPLASAASCMAYANNNEGPSR